MSSHTSNADTLMEAVSKIDDAAVILTGAADVTLRLDAVGRRAEGNPTEENSLAAAAAHAKNKPSLLLSVMRTWPQKNQTATCRCHQISVDIGADGALMFRWAKKTSESPCRWPVGRLTLSVRTMGSALSSDVRTSFGLFGKKVRVRIHSFCFVL
jgi:hypothetical protein